MGFLAWLNHVYREAFNARPVNRVRMINVARKPALMTVVMEMWASFHRNIRLHSSVFLLHMFSYPLYPLEKKPSSHYTRFKKNEFPHRKIDTKCTISWKKVCIIECFLSRVFSILSSFQLVGQLTRFLYCYTQQQPGQIAIDFYFFYAVVVETFTVSLYSFFKATIRRHDKLSGLE